VENEHTKVTTRKDGKADLGHIIVRCRASFCATQRTNGFFVAANIELVVVGSERAEIASLDLCIVS